MANIPPGFVGPILPTATTPNPVTSSGNVLSEANIQQNVGMQNSTPPVKDLSSTYGLYNLNGNQTVYNKQTGQAFSNPQDFFQQAGVNSFDNLKFDTAYNPNDINTALNAGQAQAHAAINNTPETNPDINASTAGTIIDNNTANVVPPANTTPPVPSPTNGPEVPLQPNPQYAQLQQNISDAITEYNNLKAKSASNLLTDENNMQGGGTLDQAKTLDFNQQMILSVQQMAAATKMQVAQERLTNLLAAQPVALGSPIVDKNGNATQVVRDPTTGQVATINIGNVGQPQGQYTTAIIGTHYDPLTNAQVPTYGVINTSTGSYTPVGGVAAPTPTSTYSSPLDSNLPASTAGTVSIPATQPSTPQGSQQLAYLNNNPGNLMYLGQVGAVQGSPMGNGYYYAKFSSPEAGYQALIKQVQLDQSRGETLSQFITKYAPPTSNNTAQYISQASAALGVSSNTKLNTLDPNKVAAFLAQKESGTTLISSPASSENPAITAAKNAIMQAAPNIGPNAIQTTAFGHVFIDTTQVNPNEAMSIAQIYGNGAVQAFTPDVTQTIKSINTTMASLNNIDDLIKTLPTDPMDPQRVANLIKTKLGTDPTLARLQESWQSILPDLQAQIGTQGISRLATGFLSNPDLSIVPSVTSIQGVAEAMLQQTEQLMGNRENTIFGGPPLPPNPTTYNNQVTNQMNNIDPSLAIIQQVTRPAGFVGPILPTS